MKFYGYILFEVKSFDPFIKSNSSDFDITRFTREEILTKLYFLPAIDGGSFFMPLGDAYNQYFMAWIF